MEKVIGKLNEAITEALNVEKRENINMRKEINAIEKTIVEIKLLSQCNK